jgi:hypothetical protein
VASVSHVAQQHVGSPDTTLAEWLGVEFVFSALARLERGEGRADDLERLDGFWDLPERLNAGFRAAGLGEFSWTARLFDERRERVKAQLCGAFLSDADFLRLTNPPTISTDKAARGYISSLSNGEEGR